MTNLTMFPARFHSGQTRIDPVRAYADMYPVADGPPRVIVTVLAAARDGATGPIVNQSRKGDIVAAFAGQVDTFADDRNLWRFSVDGRDYVVEKSSGCGCGHVLRTASLDGFDRELIAAAAGGRTADAGV